MNPQFLIKANINNTVESFSVGEMAAVWLALENEGKIPWLFYDGQVTTFHDYRDFMYDSSVYAYAVYHPHTPEMPLATFFVNNFIGNVGQMHFCFLDAGIPHKRAIGLQVSHFLLGGQGCYGSGLSALLGLTPKCFRHAWQYALDMGFQKVATLPKACALARRPGAKKNTYRMVDGVVTLLTPGTLLPLEIPE